MPAGTATQRTRDAVLRVVTARAVPHLIRAYYDPTGTFAGLTFDTVGNNPADRFSTDDALAISLLDTSLTPKAVRDLTEARTDEFAELLTHLPDPTVALWDATVGGRAAVSCTAAPGSAGSRRCCVSGGYVCLRCARFDPCISNVRSQMRRV